MIDPNKILTVVNRSPSVVVYRIPDTQVRRALKPGEPIRVTYEELVKLSYRDGGRYILDNYLQVTDPEARQELTPNAEQEYNWGIEDVTKLLESGSMDAFLDCLDFAPAGVIAMVKQLAVDLPLKDIDKREEIKKRYGLDVTKALEMKKAEAEEANEPGDFVPNTKRRIQKEEPEPAAPVRRVITKKETP